MFQNLQEATSKESCVQESTHRIHKSVIFGLFLLLVLFTQQGVLDAQEPLRIAVYDHSDGSAVGPKNLKKILTEEAGFFTKRVSPEDIRQGALQEFDVVILPGGSGSSQSRKLEDAGRKAILDFVNDGGGYVGICAGSYLASAEYDWSLHLINTRVIDRKHWARGNGVVRISLSNSGKEILSEEQDEVEVAYAQGPLLAPAIDSDLPQYTPLAVYETEIAEKGAPEGVMRGTTAIAAAKYGNGRVICFSPHPEKQTGPHHFILEGVRWAGNPSDP